MKTQIVTKDTMASMIVCNKFLEETPQPCRGQKHLNLVIPFESYIDFIREYSQLSKYLLSSKFMDVSEIINQPIRTHGEDREKNLYKAYLVDMAVAVGKELWYSDGALHVVSTQISNKMPTGKVMSKDDIISYGKDTEGYKLVQQFMKEMGYAPLNSVSNDNIFQVYYIGMLIRTAFQKAPWSLYIN